MNLKECPAQKFIPIYLIVAGVFGALSGFGGVGQKMTNRSQYLMYKRVNFVICS